VDGVGDVLDAGFAGHGDGEERLFSLARSLSLRAGVYYEEGGGRLGCWWLESQYWYCSGLLGEISIAQDGAARRNFPNGNVG